VFPDADYQPSVRLEGSGGALVAVNIALKLGRPVTRVDPWVAAVLGAAMPKASIDEDCDLAASKDDIWSDTH
jgi:hypothetical protein